MAKNTSEPTNAAPRTLRIALRTLVPECNDAGSCCGVDDSLLDQEERERAGRFVFERDRWSYTVAHSLLRAMLAEFHGLPPLVWRFRTNLYGRPEIDRDRVPSAPPRFNISHTHVASPCAH